MAEPVKRSVESVFPEEHLLEQWLMFMVLQKRLKKQHTSYARLLQETRMEIATQHLRHASTGITDLALQLGYADVSVFSRNFKQWSGQSPRQWRQAQQ